jgi:UDPglucose--hexose-1-phosphate uridylyltransferase
MNNIYREIDLLISYSIEKKFITETDIYFVRNLLLDYFKLTGYIKTETDGTSSEPLQEILNRMVDYAFEHKIIPENDITSRDLADTKIISLLLPMPGQIIKEFNSIKETRGIKAAAEYFYSFSIDSDYIRMDRILKNLIWHTPTQYGGLDITVNLSKPEKDPRAIAAAKLIPSSGYPECLLCPENTGFAGNLNHPARQNLRLLPLKLNSEKWWFQYSPYVYYNEHCIVLKDSHEPMKLTVDTFIRLIDFVDILPHYFIGSNADLPIVGGSILNHDHFQGGNHEFPMAKASGERTFKHDDYTGLTAEIVKWPMSVVRLKSSNRESVISASDLIFRKWKNYSDLENGIFSHTLEGEKNTPHNTVTPIARMRDGKYEMDLVLRNNLTSDEHPFGIFHPHEELHHIKKENIGLIEVMGLAVLPGRLAEELHEIENILLNRNEFRSDKLDKGSPVFKHKEWIEYLIKKYPGTLSADNTAQIVKDEVGLKFETVLTHCGVFKRDEQGTKGFARFIASAGFIEL